MIPIKTRRSIEDAFELYGRDVQLVMNEKLSDGTFYAVGNDEDGYALHGCVRFVNWARSVRDGEVYVPECYDEEASTWA